MTRVVAAAILLAIAGCSPQPRLPVALPPTDGQPPPRRPDPPPTATPGPTADTCGARPMQSLIGHPRTEVPVPVRPERQRVICTTCPMTMDYNPERLNFLFDATTGLIKEIRCG
jgi:hypothetical protein